jgi:3D (Asp-Asp-Asp) domain-containing protein
MRAKPEIQMQTRYIAGVSVCALLLTACGTRVKPVSPGSHAATTRFVATAYCQKGITKSGVRTRRGIVAADPRVLPLGTVLRIVAPGESYAGTYTVLDTGAGITGHEIDIFMPSCARAIRFGRKAVSVQVVRK